MYKKIVVPLDGSRLAECVLPHAQELASGCATEEVVLVSVTERIAGFTRATELSEAGGPVPPPGQPGGEVPVTIGKMQRQAQRYLDRIAKPLQKKGIRVRTEVLLGNPAEEITSFAEREGADLVLIASHGRSGLSRWAHGSVADKVFRATCVPVLMVRAPGCLPGI